MKLYLSPGACSLAVHIALREAGIAFEGKHVDLATHRLDDGSDYHAVSPRGYVPLLELDDGTRHTEAASLLQYVADLDPTGALIGAPRSARRLEVVEWTSFIATELHKVMSPWLWHKETADSTRAAVKEKTFARFGELNERLATREWLAGEFSIADAYAFTIVNWTRFLMLPLTAWPHLKGYVARVAARPQVHAALVAEELAR